MLRSRRRPPIYYLFGCASAGMAEMQPPVSLLALAQRRIRHGNAMLRNLNELATMLGLIVVEGYDPSSDWLRAEDLLAVLSSAPKDGVLWCGEQPHFEKDDEVVYADLVASGVIVRDQHSFAQIISIMRALDGPARHEAWDEPELVTLADGNKLVTTPRLRLITHASASIVDDSWTGLLPPLEDEIERSAFHNFHGLTGGVRTTFEGVRRGFAIERDFERTLRTRVGRALSQHHSQKGAILVHGQSGVGKTIALARLGLQARESGAAVLFAQGRLPQPGDVSEFLQNVDKIDGLTLLIADSMVAPQRYDDLLQGLRSGGHRVVVVGSTYRIESANRSGGDRFVEAPARLSGGEQLDLLKFVKRFAPEAADKLKVETWGDYALVSRFRSSYAHFACVSSVRRQKRSMDARMSPADFVQRNGLGAAFLILI